MKSRQTGLSSSVLRSKSDVKKPFRCEGLFVFHSVCHVLSLSRETFRWRSHFSLLVMVFCSHIDNNYCSETFR
ncbi:hypothetical protein BME31_12620 [Klebsiella quasipneumoniae subsp. similipneumoniae]|nr:hypothetical protein AM459_01820 [Klebsiella pneumoniae]NBZ47813.1 hypothetical protein [Klebsiella quasipneumoniae]OVX32792.1 hypothetical protein BME31_12620 [Klebsiella quasipneumoniae subsp. similipneumoniae]